MTRLFHFLWTLVPVALLAQVPADHAERLTRGTALFSREIRPVLIESCLGCHGGEKTKGGLDLATREGFLKGGSEGVSVVPFNAAGSRLFKLLRHQEEPHMPEKKPQLSGEVIVAIEKWVNDGAPYDRPLIEGRTPPRDRSVVEGGDREWWSFKPLQPVSPPDQRKWKFKNPVDRFVAEKAAGRNLSLSPKASTEILVRRAYLDLHGVPPSPKETVRIGKNLSPGRWENLVDALLGSPRYGERWARHWLDVARFAESSGFEHDYDREGAYHYRDFVIKALNSGMSYRQFIQWQIAGDEYEPGNALALSATGFLGAGVFPTQITANEVERTRYDAMDDMLSTTGAAVLGLSVGCARCHDHKYDPIPSNDYYRMLSTFTTTVRSVVDLDLEPDKTRELTRKWEKDLIPLESAVRRHERSLAKPFQTWLGTSAVQDLQQAWVLFSPTNPVAKSGAAFARQADGSFLVTGKNQDQDSYTFRGSSSLTTIRGIRLDALAHDSMKRNGPGRADNGNFALSRFRLFVVDPSARLTNEVPVSSAVATFEQNNSSLSAASSLDDKSSTGWAVDGGLGKDQSIVFTLSSPLKLPAGSLLEVRLEFQVNSRHSIGRPRLSVSGGAEPGLQAGVVPEGVIAALGRVRPGGGGTGLSDADRQLLFDWWKRRDARWAELEAARVKQLAAKPDGRKKVLICGEGFTPLRMHTQGADFLKETHVLKRGNSDQKIAVARQGFLQVLLREGKAETNWFREPPAGSKFSGRRRALAEWLVDVDNGAGALAARVAVNRLWQHHFGRGIVSTPSDFGKTGNPPSHPELLEWLAGELVRNGWQLKPIHKLIMTSATYQQGAASEPGQIQADPDNETWTRRSPRRLEGEAIRDSMLAVSGALEDRMYGPGTLDERSRRRSIYFTVKRSRLVGSMVAFDQPEPLVSQGSRPVTTVAPQALFVMNGPQVREWAARFAENIQSQASGDSPAEWIRFAYRAALCRQPTRAELEDGVAFLNSQARDYSASGNSAPNRTALVDLCQVLFGLNEFAYQY